MDFLKDREVALINLSSVKEFSSLAVSEQIGLRLLSKTLAWKCGGYPNHSVGP